MNVFDIIALLVMVGLAIAASAAEPRLSSRTVKIKYGTLRGSLVNFPNKSLKTVEVFLGIPYASPPVGKLRFMPPVTPALWPGIRNANAFGPVCPQKLPDLRNETDSSQKLTKGRYRILKRMIPMLKNQSEDCLYLNIYTPANVNREMNRLPVMMFIHGESYEWNAGSTYDGSVMASQANVVVVTINYRLGILGFYPSLGGNARGNFGLMDQVAALHWIQENIREFGGDERNVTIIGHGHGAACVNFLMLSPMARGLFHRAVMISGSALCPWAIASDAIFHAKNFATEMGCGEQANTILECLRRKSVEEILAVHHKVPTHLTAFGPVIDGIVIPADPLALMTKPNTIFGNYHLVFGVTKVESYNLFTMFDERHGIDIARRDRLLRTLVRNLFNYHLQEIFLTILNEYTDWTRPFFHPISLFDSLVEIFSDAIVVAPTIRVGLLHSKVSHGTFFYTFMHQTENGDFNPRLGCIHGQDLAYLFGAPLINALQLSWFSSNFTRTEMSLSENFLHYLANYARTGNPNQNYEGTNMVNKYNVDVIHWPPFEEIQQKFLSLDSQSTINDHYHAHKLSYWFNLLPQLHKPGSSNTDDHHFLESHNNILTYDGIVRYGSLSAPLSFNTYFNSDSSQHFNESSLNNNNTTLHYSHNQTKSELDEKSFNQKSALDSTFDKRKPHEGNASFSMIVQSGNYSTALSLTIAIGCSLLILNVLVFAGIFYQKDRNRLETKLKKQVPAQGHKKKNGYKNSANVQMYRINSITDDYNQQNGK